MTIDLEGRRDGCRFSIRLNVFLLFKCDALEISPMVSTRSQMLPLCLGLVFLRKSVTQNCKLRHGFHMCSLGWEKF